MKASVNWLKEFVDFSFGSEELAHLLTMAGLEVEGLEQHDHDTLLEINVTPNRGDCLSIFGVAREIAAIIGAELKKPIHSVITSGKPEKHDIKIAAQELCARYAVRIINNIEVGPSPAWIRARLIAHGLRPINNIVDITNYVLFEMGHPLHAFDLDKLAGGSIVVDLARQTRTFITLDGVERKISGEALLIWDKEKPVAIAGVMGGMDSEVTQNTRNILLESALFRADSIRKTSKALNLKTEASYRFERGTDINGLVTALDRCVEFICQLNPDAKVLELNDVYPEPQKPKTIQLHLERIKKIIGISIPESEIETILLRLGFSIKRQTEYWNVTVPSFRNDVSYEIDLIEEIARIHGYDKIPSILPVTPMTVYLPDIETSLIESIKDCMIKSGFSEAINYSFMNPHTLDSIKLPDLDSRRQFIKIKNPLKSEDEALRTTLLPSLLNNLLWNVNRGVKSIQLFEISRVFLPDGDHLPQEKHHLAAISFQGTHPNLYIGKHDPFYNIKGVIEAIFQKLRLTLFSFESTQVEPYLRPGYSCRISVHGNEVGSLGSLHPEVLEKYDIVKDVYILELDIDKLKSFLAERPQFQKLPKTPYVERDLALVVEKHIKSGDIQTAIKGFHNDLIESITLFDVYEGKPLPIDKKSLAYTIRYRAKDRTLRDSEIDSLQNDLVAFLNEKFMATLRS